MHTYKETIQELNRLKEDHFRMSAIYQPQFFRFSSGQEVSELTELLKRPYLKVNDEIHGQLLELLKLRNPQKRFTVSELQQEVLQFLNGKDEASYGVWVYYPWSERLVHILDEQEFIEVRTSRNQYKITPIERDLLATKKVGVVGLSVGQSVSVTMAMERICGELRLADFDRLELTNLNRIRTGVHNLGILKVHSVAREIAELDPFIKVVCFSEGLTEKNMDEFFLEGGKIDLLVEESDGFDIKVLSRYKARELKVPVIMEASDRCMVDVERFDLEPERKILHGILDHLSVEKMKSLTTNEEKIPYMFDILGLKSTSAKLRASMLEMQHTITTWPQLASAVTMGGGITADVSRRLLLNDFKESGRYYVDIEQLIGNTKKSIQTHTPIKVDDLGQDQVQKIVSNYKISASQISLKHLQSIVDAARWAPSFGNQQKWKWTDYNGNLFLFNDSKELINATDPFENFTNQSFGAAVENARQMAISIGFEVEVQIQNEISKPLIAVLSFVPNAGSKSELASAIFTRRTSNLFLTNSLPAGSLVKLQSVKHHNEDFLNLHFCDDAKIMTQLAGSLAVAEKIRVLNPILHNEYFNSELCLNSEANHSTGVTLNQLQVPPQIATAFNVISDPEVSATLLQWDKGTAFQHFYFSRYINSQAFGLISCNSTALSALVKSGMLSERLWLQCALMGIAFQPICVSLSLLKHQVAKTQVGKTFTPGQVEELGILKETMNKAFGSPAVENGVFLFRLGIATLPTHASIRKPLSEIYFSSQHSAV